MVPRFCALAAACLLAFSCTTAVAQSDGQAPVPLDGTVQIGALVPITGDGSVHGQDVRATLDLAESDINLYLQESGAGWQLDIVMEDSASTPVVALDKLTSLKARGIDLVVGTYSSAELRNVMGYATSNNMVLISYGSIAPSLAVPGDKIFRFIPDATTQAPVNARLFEAMGTSHVIPFWRGDAWGDDLVKITKERFEELGGTVHDGVRYNPEAIEFSTEVALLSDQVDEVAARAGGDNITVFLLTFSEGINIAQAAYQYENLSDVEWVGSDTLLNVGGPGSDRISSEFFESQITVTLFAPPENPVQDRVVSYMLDTVGRTPIVYSLTAYEAAWALGLSVQAAGSTDPDLVAAALPGVLEERSGIFGQIVLNDAGDMKTGTYEIWQLEGNEWIRTGTYSLESDSISWLEGVANAKAEGDAADAAEGDAADAAEGDAADAAEGDAAGGGGCLIATAAFGSELAPQVQFLREVRDGTLLRTGAGSHFMEGFNAFYYSFSPAVADLERESPELRWLVRTAVTPALYVLGIMSAADPGSEASVVALGSLAMAAIAGLYVAAPVVAACWTAGRIRGRAAPGGRRIRNAAG